MAAEKERTFTKLILPEVEVLFRVASTLTQQRADAEDLVQETLLRAYRALDSFDGRYPRAWLLTILRNTAINLHRRRRPQLLDDPDAVLDHLSAEGAASGYSTPDEFVEASFDDVVESAFASLGDKHRTILRLVDMDGLSYAEAGAVLGIPIGTVMSRLHRARTKIRRRLAAAGMTTRRGTS